MSANPAPASPLRVYTIAPGLSFLDALAAGLLARAAGEPLALSRMTVLLPTRRACRSLQEAFLRQAESRALLLPSIRPLGDIDEDAIAEFAGLEAADEAAAELPPAIPALKRRLLLVREVLNWSATRGRFEETSERGPLSPDQAARLAGELARLLDQVETEQLDLAALDRLVPEDYAQHWQETLDFLTLVTRRWPERLAKEGLLDPAERRNRALIALAQAWRAAPPAEPVIAAGSTGSIPATAELLSVIAALPEGAVVLPGLDRALDEQAWEALEPPHPQYGLKALLERLGLAREAIADWPAPLAPATPAARARLIAEALRPAAAPVGALDGADLAEAAKGVLRIDCEHPREEAGVIALLMRETLEQEGKRAALVTLDRELARRVAAELARYGVAVDDSAGLPLAETPPGTFLRLSAEAAAQAWAPVALLSALKHPLAALGMARMSFLEAVRRLEIAALRGPRPGAGLRGLRDALASRGEAKEERLAFLLDRLERAAAPFDDLLRRARVPAAKLVARHVAFAEALAATDALPGAARLWAGEAGQAAAEFVAGLHEAAPALGTVAGASYPALLAQLMETPVVRPRQPGHPRLFIWGPLEARLQHVERMILAGLNEGTWPSEPAPDPWMSRPMRRDFGLPALERRIGLSAHDFAQCFNAPEVVLTRSRKEKGTPTVPSRWLVRLEALLAAHGASVRLEREAPRWLAWQRRLEAPARSERLAPPAPRPPLKARPRRLSVTEIETWMRDPYTIYARHVLGLDPLEPLDADYSAAERGLFIHKALERFVKAHPGPLPADALARLLAEGRRAFGPAFGRTAVWAFWWPRFERIAAWFVEEERKRRDAGHRTLASEVRGRLELKAAGGPFELVAKADRIDRDSEGRLAIIDYKTGSLPGMGEIRRGLSPQLALEGLIAERGGFADLPAGRVAELAYWKLIGMRKEGEVRLATNEPAALIAEAEAGLLRLVAAFDDPETPYHARPEAKSAPRGHDYDHLARVREWETGEEEGEA